MITIEKVVRFETKYSKGTFAVDDRVHMIYKDKINGIKEYEGVIFNIADNNILVSVDNLEVTGLFNFYLENIMAMMK